MRFLVCFIALSCACLTQARADPTWDAIRKDLFQDRQIIDDGESIRIVAPKRAEDASIVPVTIYISGGLAARATQLSLIIDENPAPIAAVFKFGDGYREGNVGDRVIETRIRLNDMSAVRAVLETADEPGKAYAASQFVAGAGGCTSTSLKDMDEARASLGKTRLRVDHDATRGPAWREVLLQVRHPNFSGMQIDTKTNAYLPAHFVERIDLDVASRPLVTIESGMSIAENPSFRFSFGDSVGGPVKAVVRDTKGGLFSAQTERVLQ
ncbi:sulfur-oxidizing protein SoxY [Hyphomicrobium sp. 1Nfss2.1]|uniref:quinoprotein dehydrogenase-associated SoxYZ-like carrier n=1 Tax=Hyphomicrobium sp. 1Nfss2.1 TaxID=3413936 RepID=UPI003C7E4540